MAKFIKENMPFILVCLCLGVALAAQLASHRAAVVADEIHPVYEPEVTWVDAMWIEGRDGSVYAEYPVLKDISPLGLHWPHDDGFTPTQLRQLRQIIREELDRE